MLDTLTCVTLPEVIVEQPLDESQTVGPPLLVLEQLPRIAGNFVEVETIFEGFAALPDAPSYTVVCVRSVEVEFWSLPEEARLGLEACFRDERVLVEAFESAGAEKVVVYSVRQSVQQNDS